MPLTLLSEMPLDTYGQYRSTPTPEQLSKFFHLDTADLALLNNRRRDHNRLGMAVQLCTLRFMGSFPNDPRAVPVGVLRFLARQLALPAPSNLKRYAKRPATLSRHQHLIRDYLGYQSLSAFETFSLMRWMYTQLLLGHIDDVKLFDLATQRLITRKVVLPAASTLATLVTRVRQRTSLRVFEALSRRLSGDQAQRLEALLVVPDGKYKSPLDTLRESPAAWTVTDLYAGLERFEALRTLGVGQLDLSDISSQKRLALSQEGMTLWAAIPWPSRV